MLGVAQAAEPTAEDPYRHLEDANDPRTQEFFREQAARARQVLDRIPGREDMLARIRTLSESGATVIHVRTGGTRVFYLKLDPGQASPALFVRDAIAGAERRLLDASRYDQLPHRAVLEWFVPSPDGRHVAFGISTGGSGDSMLRVVAVDGARVLPFEIDRTRFNEELCWHPDGRSFYYSRMAEGDAAARRLANLRVYRHVLGRDTARDEIVFASGVGGALDVPEFVFPALHLPLESRYAYAIARDGARREIAVHVAQQKDLAAGKPRWHRLATHADEVLAIEGWRDDLYLLSKRNAPRHRILRVKGDAHSLAGARAVVQQGEAVIQGFGLARDALYLRTMVGGVDRLERVPLGLLGAKPAEYVRTPFDMAISQLITNPRAPGALLRMEGWIEPPAVVQVEAGTGNLRKTSIQPPSPIDFAGIDEVRLYAPGHDGTRIPVTLVYRKTTRLDAENPTLLAAFGSHGVPFAPSFDAARMAWLERGGIFAVAHVRGGGEYGDEWHRAGRQAAKVNTILDFVAVADFIVRYGFTNPKRLAIDAAGAGGVAAGGALVRRPELFAAVVARSPLMDMLGFERSPSGAANAHEFGSAATAAGAEALRQISAYHGVQPLTAYPAVLLTTSINDARVDAWQAGKMAARLQAASSGKPVLLRIDEPGPGSRPQRNAELADIYSFVLWQMGDPKFVPVTTQSQ